MAELIAPPGFVDHRSDLRSHPVLALSLKRAFDLAFGLAFATVALPLMLVVAAAIALDSPGPVVFRARRVGLHGRQFTMYKFRTMVKDAHERLPDIAHLNVAEGMVKIPNDPRITRLGKWLRRYSLDELPQIFNVIVGHMSLVGPRPHDDCELPIEGREQDPRLAVRPGLTGLWQISARSSPQLASRIRCDLDYVTGWSLGLDAKILVRTVPVVVGGRGGLVESQVDGFSTGISSVSHQNEVNESAVLGPIEAQNGASGEGSGNRRTLDRAHV